MTLDSRTSPAPSPALFAGPRPTAPAPRAANRSYPPARRPDRRGPQLTDRAVTAARPAPARTAYVRVGPPLPPVSPVYAALRDRQRALTLLLSRTFTLEPAAVRVAGTMTSVEVNSMAADLFLVVPAALAGVPKESRRASLLPALTRRLRSGVAGSLIGSRPVLVDTDVQAAAAVLCAAILTACADL